VKLDTVLLGVFLVYVFSEGGRTSPRNPRARRQRSAPAGVLSLAELRELAAGAGFPAPDVAAAVAMVESTGNPHARNLTSREDSRGLWQINVRAHPEWASTDLYDPAVNVRAALAVSGKGTNWRPWSAYTSGDYKRHLPAQAPAG
jgi:hypothetical protein